MYQNNNYAQNQARAILRALPPAGCPGGAHPTERGREPRYEPAIGSVKGTPGRHKGDGAPMRALPAAAATADRPPAPPQTGLRWTEPSMAERAFFKNKCFKIVIARSRTEPAACHGTASYCTE